MEFIIEILVEIFLEIFGEVLAAITADFISKIIADSKKRKVIKYLISSLVFIGCSVLLVLSLIYKKQLYVQLVLIYFSILLSIYVIKFCLKSFTSYYKFEKAITWINRAVHYIFPIVLILVASINNNNESKYIIIFSSIALLIYLSINIYRIVTRKKELSYKKFIKKNNKLINKYLIKENKNIKYQLINLYYQNKNDLNKYLAECDEEEFMLFIDEFLHEFIKRTKNIEFIDYLYEISNRFFTINIKNQLEQERRYLWEN